MAEEAVATPVGNGAADGKPKKKHKLSFPTAFTILFVITILAVIATWFIPAGAYSKVAYVADSGVFQITEPDGNVRTIGIPFRPRTRRHGDRCQSVPERRYHQGNFCSRYLHRARVSAHGCCRRLHLDGQWHYQRR